MTETAQERAERWAEIILEAIARTDGPDEAAGNSRHAAKLIAASDAAAGMDYDAMRKLVGEMVVSLQGDVDSCDICGGTGQLRGGRDNGDGECPACEADRALIARAQEVLK